LVDFNHTKWMLLFQFTGFIVLSAEAIFF